MLGMRSFSLCVCGLVLLIVCPAAAGDTITGRASVIDGDTIDIHGTRIRLSGIDAPESWQICRDGKDKSYLCGQEAANALDKWLTEAPPTICEKIDIDPYGRVVADCSRNDGQMVNEWLVEQGYAVDWPRYSHGDYADEQAKAKAAKRGIWQGTFELPCVARAAKKHDRPKC